MVDVRHLLPPSFHIALTPIHSQHGQSKTPEDTEKALQGIFSSPSSDSTQEKSHRIAYLIHESMSDEPDRFIGLITLRSLSPNSLSLPASFTPPSAHILELGYLFLPSAWHRGFATEAVRAILAASREADWGFERVYVRAVVSVENGGSLKVRAFARESMRNG
jgi:RimJ/RimL family protein N-acetyltransferase